MVNYQLKAPRQNGRVTIIVNAKVKQEGRLIAASPVTERMVSALKQAIIQNAPQTIIETIAVASLWSEAAQQKMPGAGQIFCPLTIQLPDWLQFPAQHLYHTCLDVQSYRQWVTDKFDYKAYNNTNDLGDCWLPIIWTKKGPLYAEVITEGEMPNAYQQPLDLGDDLRQQLYSLGFKCLEAVNAPPSVYLLQFGLSGQTVIFDRLWPFPAAPAIASLGKQNPDLFTCHWYCLNDQPL
ncbi:MAG: hypothetical protein ACRC6M_05460, partial [Microcystaceae cyanobacterium]